MAFGMCAKIQCKATVVTSIIKRNNLKAIYKSERISSNND